MSVKLNLHVNSVKVEEKRFFSFYVFANYTKGVNDKCDRFRWRKQLLQYISCKKLGVFGESNEDIHLLNI